jgi:metal-responsive CopG/Arc/MetJ family transcriptional regulator
MAKKKSKTATQRDRVRYTLEFEPELLAQIDAAKVRTFTSSRAEYIRQACRARLEAEEAKRKADEAGAG